MPPARREYTEDDDKLLIKYIAAYAHQFNGRMGNELFINLTDNEDNKWPWASHHPWKSWRERYKRERAWFDYHIDSYQRKRNLVADQLENGKRKRKREEDEDSGSKKKKRVRTVPAKGVGGHGHGDDGVEEGADGVEEGAQSQLPSTASRKAISEVDDKLLIKFIALNIPSESGRLGNKPYQVLTENANKLWPWASRHPWHSWRERYKNKKTSFDKQIRDYQKAHGIDPKKDPMNLARQRQISSYDHSQENASSSHNERMNELSDGDNQDVPAPKASNGAEVISQNGKDKAREKPPTATKAGNTVPLAEETPQHHGAGESNGDDFIPRLSDPIQSPAATSSFPTQPSNPPGSSAVGHGSPPTKAAASRTIHSPTRTGGATPRAAGSSTVPRSAAQTPSGRNPPSASAKDTVYDLTTPLQQRPQVDHAKVGGLDTVAEGGDHGATDIPPEPRRMDMTSLPSPSSHAHPLPILPSPQRAPKRRKAVQAVDDDIFKSLPPSPQPNLTSTRPVPTTPQKQRAPPVFEQGPYVSAYTSINGDSRLSPSGRRQSGVEDDVTKTVWPPKRGATNRKTNAPDHQGSFEKPSHSVPAPHPMFDNGPHHSQGSPTPLPPKTSLQSNNAALVRPPSLPDQTDTVPQGSADHLPLQRNPKPMSQVKSSALTDSSDPRRSTAQPNAVATSSRVQLTPGRSKRPLDSTRTGHPTPVAPDLKPSDSPALLRGSPAPAFRFPMSRTTDPRRRLFQNKPKPVHTIPTRVAGDTRNSRRRTLAGFPEEVPHLDLLSATRHLRSHMLDHDRRQSLPPSSIRSNSRQSTLPEVVHEHTLHRTSSITSANTDNWDSYPRQQYNPISPSRHSSASASVVSQLPESERRLTMELGAQVVLQRMAENHGLQEKLVRDIWERTNSFEKTDKVCRRMHLAMRRAYEEARAELEPSDEDSEDEGRDEDWDDPHGEAVSLSRSSTVPTASRSPKQPIQASNGLKYIPSPADAVPEHMTPALHTRAAQFVRLERQGRVDEAKKREGRRASHGGSKRVEDSPQKQSFIQPQDDEGDEFDDEDLYLNEEEIEAGPAVEDQGEGKREDEGEDQGEDQGEGEGEDEGEGEGEGEDEDEDEDGVEITEEERIDPEETGEDEVAEEGAIDTREWMEEAGGIDEDELNEEVVVDEDAMDEDSLVEEGLPEAPDPAELEQGGLEEPMNDTGDVDDGSLAEIAIVNEDVMAEEDALDEDVVEEDVPQGSDPAEPEQDAPDTVDVDESSVEVVVDSDEDYEEQADFLPGPPSPRAPMSPSSWGSYEDKLLVDGDEDALDALEAKMGPGSVKIRTAWLYSQFLFTAS